MHVKGGYLMENKDDINKLFHGQTLNMDYFLMNELRDVDKSAGTPFYKEKVLTLKRTVDSNPKIWNDPDYQKEINDVNIDVPDEKTNIDNLRSPKWRQKPLNTITGTDFYKLDTILRKYLAKYNHTFKTFETEYL